MLHPVYRRILSKGEVLDLRFVDAVVQMKEEAETRSGEKGVSRFVVNVEVGNMFRICDAIRDQIFLYREMRELYYLSAPSAVDDSDQSRTSGEYCRFRICIPPAWLKDGNSTHFL